MDLCLTAAEAQDLGALARDSIKVTGAYFSGGAALVPYSSIDLGGSTKYPVPSSRKSH